MKNLRWLAVAAALIAFTGNAFGQTCPTAPTLSSPANGATDVGRFVTLSWSNSGAARYDIFLAKVSEGGCSSTTAATSFNTTFTPPQLDAGSQYAWRVSAIRDGCPIMTSTCNTFTTAAQTCATGTPTLSAPAANAQLAPGNIVFSWSPVTGATGYELWLGSTNSGPFRVGVTTNTSETKAISGADNFTWYVVTLFGPNCPSTESPRRNFTVVNNCPTAAPTLVSPLGNASINEGTHVTVQWTAVANAVSYDVLLSGDGGQTVSVAGNTTSTSFTLSNLGARVYAWAVRANFAAPCPPTTSSASTFRVVAQPACQNGAPTLVAPADNASLFSPIDFEWTAVANATGYRLFLLGANQTTPVVAYSGPLTTATVGNLGAGVALWFVQATFANNCPNTESSRRTLTVRAPATNNCPAAPVTLTSPQNGATSVVSPVTFRWNAVANATSYTVLGSVADGSFEVFGTTTETSLQAIVPTGLIKWLVVARAQDCGDVRSAVSQFTAVRPTCPNVTISNVAPAYGALTNSPVRFEWTRVADATEYRFSLNLAAGGELQTRTTATELTLNVPAGTGVWTVEAIRGNCPSVVSTIHTLTVRTATTCASNPAATLVSPLGTQAAPAASGRLVTFKWNPVANAIAYRVWISRNGQPPSDLAPTKNTEVQRLLEEEGIYYFFVETVFEGCLTTRSGQSYFQVTTDRCGTSAPAVIAPAEGSTASAPVTFTWTAVERAKEYRVIASLNAGQPFVAGSTSDTTLTRVLPPGVIHYSVEAVFDQCPSTFSARTRFTIPESQNCSTTPAQLSFPENGAQFVAVPVTLAWSSVANAVRYVVVLRHNGGEPIPAGETTEPQLTLRTLPGGRFEWWVLTFVAGCRPIESAHSTFSTDAPDNCSTRRPLVFEPAAGTTLPPTQVTFDWSDVPGVASYRLWAAKGDDAPSMIANVPRTSSSEDQSRATVDVPVGLIRFFVEAVTTGCPSTFSAPSFFIASSQSTPCGTPAAPRANVVGQAVVGSAFSLRWTPVANADRYEIHDSLNPDFDGYTSRFVQALSQQYGSAKPQTFYFRVRAYSSCNDERSAFSNVVSTIIAPPQTSGVSRNASAEIGALATIVQTHFVPGAGAGATFSATVDKPWLTVQPSSGALPIAGITLNVIGNPATLNFGTNTATVKVTVTTPTFEGIAANGSSTSSVPFSISLVTPVTPVGKSSPPPDSLIIPAVAHALGANDSQFESDIRVTNLGATTAKYQINFTPSGVDGTTTGTSSTIEVAPSETTALDDILETMFGTGTTSIVGMLEIRPLTSSTSSTSFVTSSSGVAPLTTAASSRTFNTTPTGTFGQYIPAIPYSQFVGKGTILSLQQIAQSEVYRSNFGFAEASGQPAELIVRVYDAAGTLIASIPQSLKASEHKQVNAMLAANGITDLKDGRVEVEVLSSLGKVTAYASTVDNVTSDPLLVSPTVASSVSANRYVIPGVALLNNGVANWRTDLRVFNGGATDTAATLTFYPQGSPGSPMTSQTTLKAGGILVIDNILSSTFGLASSPGGSVIVSTPANSSIVATARTYNQTTAGTYGQFVPGVTPTQATGLGERSLQLLQLEYSTRFRTNIGLAETTGNPSRVEVSLVLPDSKVSPVLSFDLAANEFRQISLADFGAGDALYNIRATVKVVGGTGRVTAYGSAIDMLTQDPTYVPAQ